MYCVVPESSAVPHLPWKASIHAGCGGFAGSTKDVFFVGQRGFVQQVKGDDVATVQRAVRAHHGAGLAQQGFGVDAFALGEQVDLEVKQAAELLRAVELAKL